jgi:hypothetical protein
MDTSERERDLQAELRDVVDDLIHYLGGIRRDLDAGEYSAEHAALDYDILASSEVSGFMEVIYDLSRLQRTSEEEGAESASV